MVHRTLPTERYTVTYAFDGDQRGDQSDAVGHIRAAVAALRREERRIAFLGATQVVDGAGRPVTVTARYEASTQGTIGLLNCRAMLPACGPPQRTDAGATAPDAGDDGDVTLAARPSG